MAILRSNMLSKALVGCFSLIYGLSQLLPNYSWLRWKNTTSAPFPIIPFQDSPFYLGQLNRFVQGRNNFGSSVLLEHANDGYVVGSSYVFWFWGLIGRFASWNVIQTYLVLTFITGIFTFLALNYLAKSIFAGNVVSLLTTLVISLGVIKFSLGRPSPTQLCIWLTFLALGALIRLSKNESIGKFILLWCVFMALIFSNPFYALLIAVCAFTLNIVGWKHSSKIFRISTFLILLVCLLYSKLGIDKSSNNIELQDRFGFIWDRLPGAVSISLPAVMIGLFSFYMFYKSKIAQFRTIFALMAAILGTVNSQIVTGIVFEMESHLSSVAKTLFALSTLYLVKHIMRHNFNAKITLYFLAIFASVSPFMQSAISYFETPNQV